MEYDSSPPTPTATTPQKTPLATPERAHDDDEKALASPESGIVSPISPQQQPSPDVTTTEYEASPQVAFRSKPSQLQATYTKKLYEDEEVVVVAPSPKPATRKASSNERYVELKNTLKELIGAVFGLFVNLLICVVGVPIMWALNTAQRVKTFTLQILDSLFTKPLLFLWNLLEKYVLTPLDPLAVRLTGSRIPRTFGDVEGAYSSAKAKKDQLLSTAAQRKEELLDAASKKKEELVVKRDELLDAAQRKKEELVKKKDELIDVAQKKKDELIDVAQKKKDELLTTAQHTREEFTSAVQKRREALESSASALYAEKKRSISGFSESLFSTDAAKERVQLRAKQVRQLLLVFLTTVIGLTQAVLLAVVRFPIEKFRVTVPRFAASSTKATTEVRIVAVPE